MPAIVPRTIHTASDLCPCTWIETAVIKANGAATAAPPQNAARMSLSLISAPFLTMAFAFTSASQQPPSAALTAEVTK